MSTRSTTAIDVTLGHKIKAARIERGISQGDLGELIGVTFQQVQKYEHGSNRVTVQRLIGLAAALEKPMSYFLPTEIVKGNGLTPTSSEFMADKEGMQIVQAWPFLDDRLRKTVRNLAVDLSDQHGR